MIFFCNLSEIRMKTSAYYSKSSLARIIMAGMSRWYSHHSTQPPQPTQLSAFRPSILR